MALLSLSRKPDSSAVQGRGLDQSENSSDRLPILMRFALLNLLLLDKKYAQRGNLCGKESSVYLE